MLPKGTDQEIFFFRGKDYVPLFCALSTRVSGRRIGISPGDAATSSAWLDVREI